MNDIKSIQKSRPNVIIGVGAAPFDAGFAALKFNFPARVGKVFQFFPVVVGTSLLWIGQIRVNFKDLVTPHALPLQQLLVLMPVRVAGEAVHVWGSMYPGQARSLIGNMHGRRRFPLSRDEFVCIRIQRFDSSQRVWGPRRRR